MKIKNRIKRYITEKPKGDFWMWAFITILLFRYVSFPAIMFLPFFQIGLISPELQPEVMQETFTSVSENLVSSFVIILEKLFLVGQGIAESNPLVAKILFFGMGYIVWVLWVAMAFLIINLLRYGISYSIRKVRDSKLRSKK